MCRACVFQLINVYSLTTTKPGLNASSCIYVMLLDFLLNKNIA